MLGDDVAWAMPKFRREAESLMLDTCTITRAEPGNGEWDEETGTYEPLPASEVYGPSTEPHLGKCRLQDVPNGSSPLSVDAGERQGSKQEYVLQLPVEGSGHIAVNDVVKMLAVQMDSSLVEREYTVLGRHGKSQATKRALRVVEVTS